MKSHGFQQRQLLCRTILIGGDSRGHPNQGQADLTVKGLGHLYVMEIKVVDGETVGGNPALDQIIQRGYADKYRGLPGYQVHQIGMMFSSRPRLRNLIAFDAVG
ncbi:MAG: PD-(D/E)XK nuclease domain-containing protein [Chromatiales bacterium]|nr:PD-(D/E)XK nuclease domain-containing protein [Chromatiales bacterium]